jgi:hypothetical protein
MSALLMRGRNKCLSYSAQPVAGGSNGQQFDNFVQRDGCAMLTFALERRARAPARWGVNFVNFRR